MACTTEEFLDLINNDADLDLQKLRESARRGIPVEVRGEVWKYLLLGDNEECRTFLCFLYFYLLILLYIAFSLCCFLILYFITDC
jgi:hypothetical protein